MVYEAEGVAPATAPAARAAIAAIEKRIVTVLKVMNFFPKKKSLIVKCVVGLKECQRR